MFDDVQPCHLISFVHSEQLDRLQEAEDGDPADDVPAKDGRCPGRVPEQHLEGGVAPSEKQTWWGGSV